MSVESVTANRVLEGFPRWPPKCSGAVLYSLLAPLPTMSAPASSANLLVKPVLCAPATSRVSEVISVLLSWRLSSSLLLFMPLLLLFEENVLTV